MKQTTKWQFVVLAAFAFFGGCFRFDSHKNGYALLNIENILIGFARRNVLWPLRITVEVEHEQLIEGFKKSKTHSTECRVIQVAMVGDES